MRISTYQQFKLAVDSMNANYAAAGKTQLQLSKGTRLLSPADDPAAAAEVLSLVQVEKVNGQYQKNIDAANARLGLQDTTMQSTVDLLQRIREIALQSNTSALNTENRVALAAEVEQHLSAILGYANTKDAGGEYLFSGYQSHVKPFTKDLATGDYIYAGDEGQRYLQIGPSQQVATTDSGTTIFRSIPNGNGIFVAFTDTANTGTAEINQGAVNGQFIADRYTITMTQTLPTDPITYAIDDSSGTTIQTGTYVDGETLNFNGAEIVISGLPMNGDVFHVDPSGKRDVFGIIDDFIEVLKVPAITPSATENLNEVISTTLDGLDRAINNMLSTRAEIGARLNSVDAQKVSNDSFTLQAREARSTLEDLDVIAAISDLNRQTLGLQAAQQSFLKIQGLSLFNYLS